VDSFVGKNMALLGAASCRGLAVLLWLIDGLLWAALVMSSMNIGFFLRGGVWLLTLIPALMLPIPATVLWRLAKKSKT
jgi:hypothetical protein